MNPNDEIDSLISTNLERICDEYVHWSMTGTLGAGVIRELVHKIQTFYPMDTAMALFDAKIRIGDFLIRKQHAAFIF